MIKLLTIKHELASGVMTGGGSMDHGRQRPGANDSETVRIYNYIAGLQAALRADSHGSRDAGRYHDNYLEYENLIPTGTKTFFRTSSGKLRAMQGLVPFEPLCLEYIH
jgi:hypothetical protein